jgi:AraC-like DNA-binding protein
LAPDWLDMCRGVMNAPDDDARVRRMQGFLEPRWQAFFEAVLAQGESRLQWADVAATAGYSDQSPLCRETRRVSGFAPQELRRRIRDDESFWPDRIGR